MLKMSKYKKGEALPIEEFLYSHINPVLGTFLHEKMKMTPNMITTITLLMSFVIGWNLWNNNYYTACVLILIRQILDSTDGFIARKYNLKSKFGEKYDNISDDLNNIITFTILLYKGRHSIMNNKCIFLLIVGAIILYINNMITLRNNCLKNKDCCSDPNVKHDILKSTHVFSLYEICILMCVGIILFSKYIPNK